MTFEEWCDKMEKEGWIWMSESYNTPADRTMAREAWKAGREEGKVKMLKLLDDFEDLISSACPDASMYCDDGGLADRLEELRV